MKKVSFLISAHNEEKLIHRPLENLLHLPYDRYEVLIGLDGCTDKTEEIVRSFCLRSRKFRYFSFSERRGKPEIINRLLRHATGELIVIHDADWIFSANNKKTLHRFFSVFDDPTVGGIAESFPVEWAPSSSQQGNLAYKMVAYSSFLWFSYQKEHFAVKKEHLFVVTHASMFLTNIFRKKLYTKNFSLGDDFERTASIMQQGSKVVLFERENMPRMIATYTTHRLRDLFKQKIRTAAARKQLLRAGVFRFSLFSYYSSILLYFLKHLWHWGIVVGFLLLLWIFLFSFATFLSSFRRTTTRGGWTLRARR